MDFVKVAKEYISKGIPVIPVSSTTKTPQIGNWHVFQKRLMTLDECEINFKNATGIAVLCGGNWRIFCLDADMKYSLSHDTWDNYKEKLGKDLLSKLVCQKTRNSGYHLLCKVPKSRLNGNEKFASRYTTAYEKHKTYLEAYENPRTRDNALRIASNDKSRVLFESRSGSIDSAGGYFLISPTEGYEVIFGKSFKELTEQEYDFFIEATRSFNEVLDKKTNLVSQEYTTNWVVNPFEDFNEKSDPIDTLIKFGWDIIDERGKSIRLKRPGGSFSKSSALYDTESKIFNCFSTSTEFDVSKGYSPLQVYALLECEEDYSLVYKNLIELGYGKR